MPRYFLTLLNLSFGLLARARLACVHPEVSRRLPPNIVGVVFAENATFLSPLTFVVFFLEGGGGGGEGSSLVPTWY